MRWPLTLPVFALVTLISTGCGQPSNLSTGPGPTANPKTLDTSVQDSAEILKEINKTSNAVPEGASQSMTQVGSHRLKTIMDVPASTAMQDERAVITFGSRKVAVEFDRGQVVFDETGKATLPPGTKEVEIQFMKGKLTVKADGAAVPMPAAPQ